VALIRSAAHAAGRIAGLTAIAVFGLSLVYALVLSLGLIALKGSPDPIGDPWFTLMEILILLMAPLFPVLWAAIHVQAPPAARAFTLAGLMFVSLAVALTSSVHVLVLALGQGPGDAGSEWLDFRWPSAAYAVDLLAWDVFFGLATLLAAPAFGGDGLDARIRALLIASGALSLAGLLGPLTGDMNLRLLGVAGYAVVFPVAAGLIAIRFRLVHHRPVAGPQAPLC